MSIHYSSITGGRRSACAKQPNVCHRFKLGLAEARLHSADESESRMFPLASGSFLLTGANALWLIVRLQVWTKTTSRDVSGYQNIALFKKRALSS